MKENTDRIDSKKYIEELSASLSNRDNKSTELLDIIDVLNQVDKRLDETKDVPPLINRLVNYIRSVSLAGKIDYPKADESLMIELSNIGKKAGINGAYMADFSDKSQFYGLTEEIPRH